MSPTTYLTLGWRRLRRSVEILPEMFVILFLLWLLVLTGHCPKTWVNVQWYFSGGDIAAHKTMDCGV